jgi:hypothetical protein
MQSDPIVVKASELLRLGLMPSADEIKAGAVSVLRSYAKSTSYSSGGGLCRISLPSISRPLNRAPSSSKLVGLLFARVRWDSLHL